jgi:xanthine/CO dehydrogenase XdhC/CoxF family maturation factor
MSSTQALAKPVAHFKANIGPATKSRRPAETANAAVIQSD